MALHLIKLCVGVETLQELALWQKGRLAEMKKKKRPLELVHVTRHKPKRAEELLDGGSIYWVIKGQVAARQPLIDLRPAIKKRRSPIAGSSTEPQARRDRAAVSPPSFRDGADF